MTTDDPAKTAAESALLSANKAKKKTRGPRRRVSALTIDRALRSGRLPHEVLLEASRTGKLPMVSKSGKKSIRAISSHQQLFAASAAAPFFAPKLSAVQVSPPPKPPDSSDISLMEVARRQAWIFAQARQKLEAQRQPREPLLLEGRAEVVEPVPAYTEVDNRPKPAAPTDALQALKSHSEDLERVRQEHMHETPGEQGREAAHPPRAITGRRPFTGGGEE